MLWGLGFRAFRCNLGLGIGVQGLQWHGHLSGTHGIHRYIHTSIHKCMHTYIHTCIHTYIHTYIHAYIHAFLHTNMICTIGGCILVDVCCCLESGRVLGVWVWWRRVEGVENGATNNVTLDIQ